MLTFHNIAYICHMTTSGIVMVAFGHPSYAYAARNLAYSIRRFDSGISIALIADTCIDYLTADDKAIFNLRIPIPFTFHEPAEVKIRLYELLPYTHCLYLDVDALCVSDPGPHLDRMIASKAHYLTSVMGKGKVTEPITYNVWATPADIVDFFAVPEGNDIVAIQSSWAYIKVCAASKALFANVIKYYNKGFDRAKLLEKWGGGMPDELLFSGVLSKMGIDAAYNEPFMFFGDGPEIIRNEIDMGQKYCIMSLYGNGNGRPKTPLRYWDLYDAVLRKWSRKDSAHYYKADIIRKHKHANNR